MTKKEMNLYQMKQRTDWLTAEALWVALRPGELNPPNHLPLPTWLLQVEAKESCQERLPKMSKMSPPTKEGLTLDNCH